MIVHFEVLSPALLALLFVFIAFGAVLDIARVAFVLFESVPLFAGSASHVFFMPMFAVFAVFFGVRTGAAVLWRLVCFC